MAEAPLIDLAKKSYELTCGLKLLVTAIFRYKYDVNIAGEVEFLRSEFAECKNGNSEFGESRQLGRFENVTIGGVAPERADIGICCAIKKKCQRAPSPAFVSGQFQSRMRGLWCWEAEPV